MRKLIYIIFIVVFFTSCLDNFKLNNKQDFSSQLDMVQDSTSLTKNSIPEQELPTQNYFEIVNISQCEFEKDLGFIIKCEVINKSNLFFSKVILNAELELFMKSGRIIDLSPYIQGVDDTIGDLGPQYHKRVINWEPNTTRKFIVYSPGGNHSTTFYNVNYNQTPKEILITFFADAISIDEEPEGGFAQYSLLKTWKERQVFEGYRSADYTE